LALLLAVAVVGWAAAKPYLVGRDTPAAAKLDPRALSFLSTGEKAMGEGDLDLAQENLDKASALAEKETPILVDQARLAAIKADVAWLKLRLLPADAIDEQRATRAQLDMLAARERKAADEAQAVAPADISTERAKIDALRLAGDLGAARGYVSKVIAHASQPETAYVLAALDLAEPEPLWATVIERLRLAAAGEGNVGRARAALIYALAKSGDVEGAQTELAKLEAIGRPYPLVPNLRAFIERSTPKTSVPPPLSSSIPRAALSATSARAPGGPPAPPAGDVPAGDPRAAMRSAAQAIRKGDFSRARQIYQSIVDRNPNDSEALAGLGDVARLQGNAVGAISIYRQAVSVNPSYLPALLGVADTEWATGQRSKAIHDYTDIVDRFPEGTYPAYVGQRVSSAGAAAAPTATASSQTSGTAPTAPVPSERPEL
jgi:tetratricopeptide (TPR) repeat protein